MDNRLFIEAALREDVGEGDFSTVASIPADAQGIAVLKVKEAGIVAGIALAEEIFKNIEPSATFSFYKSDGDKVVPGDIAFELSASVHTILKGERLALNCMQRMSGIATLTHQYTKLLEGYHTRILDTRKTTPLFRKHEKDAVAIGGGVNHRMGLYDMVMLKDNHIDFCGGLEKAITQTRNWLQANSRPLKIEVETRTLADVEEVLRVGGVDRIMLDNFSPAMVEEAVKMIAGKYETEASGGITFDSLIAYAETGVDFVSCGAIIHHAVSMDLSLKARIK